MATKSYSGLTQAEVAARIASGDTNAFHVQVGRGYMEIFRDNVFTIFNTILFILLVILIFYGETISVIFAGFSVVLNSIIGVAQEVNAKRALEQLASLSVQEVNVYRDGSVIKVPIQALVKDDVIPVEPGDRVVVDGKLLDSDSLEMDESPLTGESDSIQKETGDELHSGSFVIAGAGVMVAENVGANSHINKLSQTAKAYRHILTPTQQEIARIVQYSILGMSLFGPMTVIAGLAQRLPGAEIVLNAVVTVTSFVPQGLVLTVTVSLVLGALRISRRQTLVQRTNAVESLANVNVLCFDKTGTLTRNLLSVTQVIPLENVPLEEIRRQLHIYCHHLAHQNKTAAAIAQYTGSIEASSAEKIHEVPFTSARKWGAVVLENETLYLGAPERVLRKGKDDQPIMQSEALARQGMRVLGFARSEGRIDDENLARNRRPIALVVMSDQVRSDINQTLRSFEEQKVALKVISGDNVETVGAIAQQAGMTVTKAFTGDQLETMTGPELESAVKEGNLFARIEPETKRKIIRTLKAQGNYVAMVGDGVNDVPALKEANMAIAMNDGAQIAKDIADVVLLNNAMSTLPLAFAEGKNITQKILASARLFLTKNFYTILAFIFIGFMTLPFATNPIQISWLTFGAVNIPALLITFDLTKPMPVRSFRKDIVPYAIIAIVVGALVSSALYAIIYLEPLFRLPPDEITKQVQLISRDAARSAFFMFMFLYGLIVMWNTHGISVFDPESVRQRWRTALLLLVLTGIAMAAAYQFPGVFGFVPPTSGMWAAILIATAAAATGLHYALNSSRVKAMMNGEVM